MKITNTQPGPRGVNTVTGTVLIDPGQTVEADIYAREQQHLDASGWFEIDGRYTPDPDKPAAPPMNSTGAEQRDDNGDTLEMAAMRKRFDDAYKARSDELRAAGDEITSWKQKSTDLESQLAAANGKIADLNQTIADLEAANPKTAAQVLAMFDDPAVHFQTAKSEALKLLGDAAPSSQTKDDLVAALKAKA